MLIIGLVFQFVLPIKIDNYFYFLFAGLLPWNLFSFTITKCTPLFLNERALIQKAKFPREALVLSIVFSNLFHFFIAITMFIALNMILGLFTFWKLGLMILIILWLLTLTIGISFLLSSLFVKYRDIKFIVEAIIPLWFYATPIIYTKDILPSTLQTVLNFNPMTAIIELFQYAFNHPVALNTTSIGISLTTTVLIFILGIYLFIKQSPYFDDWL